MENYTETIDLINAYINNTLSKAERLVFENRLKTDSEFNNLYNEHLAILEGVKRVELINEIQAAKQSYVRSKWMKYIGVSVVLLSVIAYSFIFKTETPQVVEPTVETIEIISDSLKVEKLLDVKNEEPIVTEKAITEKNEIGTSETSEIKEARNESPIEEIVEKKEIVITEASEEAIVEKPEGLFKKAEAEPTTPELKAFFKSVKKAPQIIEVNTEKEYTVTCKEGTKLTIPAKSFVDEKTGKLARGKINLEVTEYYKLSDMLLANLTTKSDDKQLETGGMLYLDANKKGKKLKLKSGKRIKMAFNNRGKKDMQLFSGEESNESVNWKLQSQNLIMTPFEDVTFSMDVVEEPPLYPGCSENVDTDEIKKCLSDRISEYIKKNYDNSIADDDSKLTGKIKLFVYFDIDQDGEIVNIVSRAPNKRLCNETIRVLESLPKLQPGFQRGMPVKVQYFMPFYITKKGKTRNYDVVEVKGVRGRGIGIKADSTAGHMGTIKGKSQNNIANYAFSSANLGWINCDRFTRIRAKKIKYKLKIKKAEGANVKMFFKSISSILPSGKRKDEYDFGNIPINEDVFIIGIKKKHDKLYFGKKETNTSTVSEMDLDFKEVTLEELKSELQALNKSFK